MPRAKNPFILQSSNGSSSEDLAFLASASPRYVPVLIPIIIDDLSRSFLLPDGQTAEDVTTKRYFGLKLLVSRFIVEPASIPAIILPYGEDRPLFLLFVPAPWVHDCRPVAISRGIKIHSYLLISVASPTASLATAGTGAGAWSRARHANRLYLD